jgi:hypothetical protein
MIICPSCQHQEVSGAIFCSECGAQLNDIPESTTKAFSTDSFNDAPVVEHIEDRAVDNTNSWITIHLQESGQLLPLSERTEFTLGRVVQDQPVMPDVDFSAYNAYENGVSRLHAVLKRDGNNVSIMDIGSSNGTYLNGKKIAANIAFPIRHGDLISLGKLKLQILLRSK